MPRLTDKDRYPSLECPAELPEGITREQAEELLRVMKHADGGESLLAVSKAVDLGLFTIEYLDELAGTKPQPPAASKRPKSAAEPERPARLRSLAAENSLLRGWIGRPEAIAETAEITGPAEFGSVPNRRIGRAILDLVEWEKPVDEVLLRDALAGDDAATATQAGAAFEAILLLDVPTVKQMRSYAELIHRKYVKHAEQLDREEAVRLFADPKIHNGVLQARVGDLMAGIAERESPGEREIKVRGWPEPASEEALYGVAGDIVRAIAPITISDPMAILGQFLVAFSNMMGRNPCFIHEETRHALNLYMAVVGPTALGYKGTALNNALKPLEACDPDWQHTSGLVSGEGLVHCVRDPSHKVESREHQLSLGKDFKKGVKDKRVLFIEREFGSTLTLKGRKGSTLGHHLRLAFDGDNMGALRRNDPSTATDYHVSLIGHGTFDEVVDLFPNLDKANGLGNRFLWVCARQSQVETPEMAAAPRPDWDANGIRAKLKAALKHAQTDANDPKHPMGLVLVRDPEAERLWNSVKAGLANPGPGLDGAMRARGRPIVMRMAGIYAMLDSEWFIRVQHLMAALAYWRFSERSVSYTFREDLGSEKAKRVEKQAKLFEALRKAAKEGLTVRDASRLVFRSKPGEAALFMDALIRDGQVSEVVYKTKGNDRKAYVLRGLFS